jgi:transposase
MVIVQSKKELPQDLETLQSYSWNLSLAYQQLTEKYRKLLGSSFGRSSEKLNSQADLDALQLELEGLMAQGATAQLSQQEQAVETVEITAHHRRRKHPGRNAIPEELITEETLDIPDAEKNCPCCGLPMSVIDIKKHVVVERIPAKYTAKRYLRPVYGCSLCKSVLRKRCASVQTNLDAYIDQDAKRRMALLCFC